MNAPVRLSEAAGRWVLVVTAAGSGLVLLEATVVNVALPAVGSSLDASMAGLQWTVNAFALALSALILLGGSLGDRFGRRRVYLVGMAWFGAASLLCGAAPSLEWLIVGRVLQGIGGALIVPGSLALIQGSFHPDDRNRAVGWWAGMSGVAGAAGPMLGGVLVDAAGWRWVFLINVPLAAILGVLLVMRVPEARGDEDARRFDVLGALLAAIALAALTYALIEASDGGGATAIGLLGLAVFAAFLFVEHRSPSPMLPLGLFRSRPFSVANLGAFFAYGGLAGMFFLLPIQLQITAGYSALAAGLSVVPLTFLTLLLSPYGGELTSRYGARLPLVAGSAMGAASLLLATRIDGGMSYWTDLLPVVALMGVGVPLITPPITSTVLSSVPDGRAGIASAVNNGVARAAGLVVVAALPLLAGLPQDATDDPAALDSGYTVSMLICAGLFAAGGVVCWLGLPPSAAMTASPVGRCQASLTCPQLEPARD
jgi:EmrB/QacA subfamily drug resistance transporter